MLVGHPTNNVYSSGITWDSVNNYMGVNNITPAYAVDITGDINVSGNIKINGVNIA